MKNCRCVLFIPLLFIMSCATPVPKAGDYYQQVPQSYLGLHVDIDLLSTSKLSQDNRRVAEELLNSYYSAEHSLTEYITALEMNLDANEQLKNKYTIADSIVGGLVGFSCPHTYLCDRGDRRSHRWSHLDSYWAIDSAVQYRTSSGRRPETT